MNDCNLLRLKSSDRFIFSGPSYMVVIIKLRSEIGCDTFTRKHKKISRKLEEEIKLRICVLEQLGGGNIKS